MTTADLNRDKHLDLAVVDEANSVSVMLGNGRGGFTTQSPLNTNNLPTQAMAADFNNDGNLDLLVDGGQPSTLDGIYLDPFLGNGAGVFTALTPIPGGDGYAEGTMASGDFNEDGNLDVAVGVNTAPSQGNN